MRKLFKIILIVICFYIAFYIIRGGYYYCKYRGNNVSVIFSTQFSPMPSSISLYIDNNLCYKNDSLQIMYEFLDIKTTLGMHKLKVNIDNVIFERWFYVLPVRWIYIEIQKYDVYNYKENENWVYIDFSNTPLGLM